MHQFKFPTVITEADQLTIIQTRGADYARHNTARPPVFKMLSTALNQQYVKKNLTSFQCQNFSRERLMRQMEWKVGSILGLAFNTCHKFQFGHFVSCQPRFQSCCIVIAIAQGSWTAP